MGLGDEPSRVSETRLDNKGIDQGRGRVRLWLSGGVLALIFIGSIVASVPLGGPTEEFRATTSEPTMPQQALLASEVSTPIPSTIAMGLNAQAQGCSFVLGFAKLRQMIGPAVVGDCLEDQSGAENGDAVQRTTNGLLVWRKADNRAAFTDGATTWIDGPYGLQKRPSDERLAWEGALPGAVLPGRRIVSYYGNPLSAAMGILGELSPQQMMARLRQQAEAYAAADPGRPVHPAIELVAIVAQEGPGADGMYRLQMDTELIEEVAQWAEQNDFLLILDVQPGRSSVAAEVRAMLPFLKRPFVHLALDPEFAMATNQRPGQAIGSIDAAAINDTIRTLGQLVTAEQLPPKLLIVHRFTENMVTNHHKIQLDPRVQVAIAMDGFGSPAAKIGKHQELVRDQPVQFSGFKLFYRQDVPVITPDEVIKLDPSPDVVIYQ
jgi:hypothetical protein